MTTAHLGYPAPAPTPADRTRSAYVIERERSRRMARALKRTPTQLDVEQLQRELSSVEVAR